VLWLALAGPRLSARSTARVRPYVQLLAGAAIYEGGAAFLALPGAGIDFALGESSGFRVQAEWPILTTGGVYTGAPRLSASVSFRPGTRHAGR